MAHIGARLQGGPRLLYWRITTMTAITADNAPNARTKWLKRAGIAGFWFFFIKGLLWLAAPFVFYFML